MAQFEIDLDVLIQTQEMYMNISDNIGHAISEAEVAIGLLKSSGWESEASRKYFDNFDNKWKVNMQNRQKVVDHLASCLLNAYREYNSLYEEAVRIKRSS